MRLKTIGARHFRNLEEFQLEPHPRFNVIAGPNAQGKTNLLESIFVLGALKSFRTSSQKDLVTTDEKKAIIQATLERGPHVRNIKLQLGGGGRKVWLNDRLARRLSDYLGTFQVVLFAPEDVSLLKGSPSARRTFLDRAVFNARAAYLEDLNRYEEVLKQRNGVLKDENPRRDLLEVYNQQLLELGTRVIDTRLTFLQSFSVFFARAFGDIFGANISARLTYEPSWTDEVNLDEPMQADQIYTVFEAALASKERSELRRGYTLVGPHRDDFSVLFDDMPVKTYASQGQHRAIVLALKTSEITMLRERFDVEPVLLLDDVSSELDRDRNSQLFDFLQTFTGQVFITTTSREYILLNDEVSVWNVSDGRFTLSEDGTT